VDLHRLAKERRFSRLEGAKAYLGPLLRGMKKEMGFPLPRGPMEMAQGLVREAWQSNDPERAKLLAWLALKICPDCADAYNVLAETAAQTPEEMYACYRRGVEVSERVLGEEYFKANRGYFWRLPETRPYMRAREGLADCLCLMERWEEAIRHYEEMLELNPNDEQGIRHSLLAAYLHQGDLDGADRLFQRYGVEESVFFIWSRVLWAFLRHGPESAREAMLKAMEQNPYVREFLTGPKRSIKDLPPVCRRGNESEALVYLVMFIGAWRAHPEALQWLREQEEASTA
jgi:tetratricopeptide (TPR) repeat protein